MGKHGTDDDNSDDKLTDAGLAEAARKALADAGFHPAVIVGEGTDGHPPRAPYDRIISDQAGRPVAERFGLTCGMHGEQVWLDSPGNVII